jgi:exosortase/archaeosortase family protein
MKIKCTMPARLLLLCSLAWLWFTLINHLRVEWSVNPQYAYGWAVPFLCLYLLWRNAEMLKVEMGTTGPQDHETTGLRDYGTTEPGGQEAKGFRGKAEMLKAETLKSSGLEAEGGEGKAETLKTSTHKAEVRGPRSVVRSPVVSRPVVSGPGFSFSAFQLFSFFLLSFLYLPTRLVQEANPEWRLVSWALAFEVIGLTLLLLKITEDGGQKMEDGPRTADHRPETTDHGPRTTSPISRFTHHASRITHHVSRFPFQLSAFSFSASVFPILFFLVAVPWPTFIEGPLVQGLMRANVGATIELLALTGVPAIQHGNVIEIANGVVDIDDACSGIRSLQAALMLSLFFGEVYRLAVRRRLMLVVLGFLLAFAFNVGRTLLLTQVAAAKGIGAVATWHDPASVTILVACFLCLWLMAKGLRGKAEMLKSSVQRAEVSGSLGKMGKAESRKQKSEPVFARFQYVSFSAFQLFSIFLTFWLILVEAGTELWYRSHEWGVPKTAAWKVELPRDNPTFRDLPLSDKTKQFLRYDEAFNGAWQQADGQKWQAIFLRWNPGRIAVQLAKSHTPEVCLTAAGRDLVSQSGLRPVRVHGLEMPFRSYVVKDESGPLHVFYCLWEDRASAQSFRTTRMSYANRLAPVLAGRRNSGQRSLEVAIWGIADQNEADAALARELEKLIHVEK